MVWTNPLGQPRRCWPPTQIRSSAGPRGSAGRANVAQLRLDGIARTSWRPCRTGPCPHAPPTRADAGTTGWRGTSRPDHRGRNRNESHRTTGSALSRNASRPRRVGAPSQSPALRQARAPQALASRRRFSIGQPYSIVPSQPISRRTSLRHRSGPPSLRSTRPGPDRLPPTSPIAEEGVRHRLPQRSDSSDVHPLP